MKKLLKYITEYQKECILGPLFKLLEACFDLTVPMVMAWLIDRGISQNNVPYIWKMGGLLLVLAAIGLTCSITAQYFAAKAAVGFATKLRHAVFEHIESLSFTEMDEAGTSMMITRMTSDINQVQSVMITLSPQSTCGVKVGLYLPRSNFATFEQRRPTTWSVASITTHSFLAVSLFTEIVLKLNVSILKFKLLLKNVFNLFTHYFGQVIL